MRTTTLTKTRRAFLVAAISFAVMLPSIATAYTPGERFNDDNGNIHEAAIEAIADEGITKGCNPPSNTKYCPDRTLTREEVAAFIDRSFDLPTTSKDYFRDDSSSLHHASINRLAKAGITNGCFDGRFCPTRTVTRAEVASMLAVALKLPATSKNYFKDDNGHTLEDGINRLAKAGITNGCNPPANDEFCPNRNLKRDEFATLMARALDLDLKAIVYKPPSTPPPSGDGEILWRGDVETGDTSQWKSVAISGNASVQVVSNITHSGRYALKLNNFNVDGSHSPGVRMNLQGPFGENPRNLPDDGYYSAWYYIPNVFEGDSNIFQFKQSAANKWDSNGNPISKTRKMLWKISLNHDSGNKYDLEIRTRINQDTGQWTSASLHQGMIDANIPVGEWFHLETRYKWGKYGTGRTTVWLNGEKVWDRAASTWAPNLECLHNCREFTVNHYLGAWQGYVSPGNSSIYIDDVVLATGRVGPG